MATSKSQVVKKTLLLDPHKLEKLRRLFNTDNTSEAVRQVIDEALAYKDALEAARRIQKRKKFAR
jgi:hypothetical protein